MAEGWGGDWGSLPHTPHSRPAGRAKQVHLPLTTHPIAPRHPAGRGEHGLGGLTLLRGAGGGGGV